MFYWVLRLIDFFLVILYMNLNIKINIGLFVGFGVEGKCDNVLNKFIE